MLFVVYEVWVTNLLAARRQVRVHNQLEQQWAAGRDPLATASKLSLPGRSAAAIPLGTGIANIYLPRLGPDFHFTVVQGTDDASLERGPGHYLRSALPGQLGNFAVAGHRVGKGEPFLNLDQLHPRDAIVIETEASWFIYRVKGPANDISADDADGVPGRRIVSPSDSQVILPVPDQPGATPTERLITLTTCHPKFTANQRMIIHGVLARQVARTGNQLPRELVGGTI
jgi:sortase A